MPRTFTEDEVRELIEAAVAPLRARIAELEAKVAVLEAENARLKKDSSTSSKPPSSDIVKPPRPPATGGRRGKRRQGGQPGHRQHLRPSFPPEQVDHFFPILEWSGEPLGPEWVATDEFRTIQQVELAEKLVEVTEYRARLYRSWATDQVIAAPFPEEVARAGLIGPRLTATIKVLFRTWHRRGPMPDKRWKREAERAQQAILKAVRRPPPRSEAENIAKRFREHGEYYFTFLKVPGVEPTNNAMERGFRHLVIDRKVTQGTRGERGRRWCERIWTALATCAQQGRSAFQFIYHSIVAYFTNHLFPSLLPQGP